MFEIKNDVSLDEAKRIRKEIHDAVEEIGKEYNKKFELYKIIETIACYALWVIKLNPSISSYTDMTEKMKLNTSWYLDDFADIFIDFDDSMNRFVERSEAWEKFKSLAKEYSSEELVAAICKVEFIEDEYYDYCFNGTPTEVGCLVDKLLGVSDGENIVQVGGSSYVFEALERNSKIHLTAQREEDFILLTIVPIIADVLGISNIDCIMSFEEDKKYDKAFINNGLEQSERVMSSDIQFDIKNEWDGFPSDISEEWNACAIGVIKTKESGKTVAIMNAGQMTLNKYCEVRAYLCERGYIEGVILLPDKMYSNTWINPYILVLSRNNKSVKFLDARKEYVASRVKGKRINVLNDEIIDGILKNYSSGTDCVSVSLEEIKKSDYVLTPNRYVEISNTDVNKIKLGDIVKEIKRGITLSASDMDQMIMEIPSDIRCLQPSDIGNGVITSERYFHGELKKPGKNEAHRGDILISKTGNPFRIVVADQDYLIVGNIYILSIDSEKICPEYLKCYLSSKAGQLEIMKYASGTATPIISVGNLRNIEIPVYDEATQKELNQHAIEIVNSLNESYRQIRLCESEMNSLFS